MVTLASSKVRAFINGDGAFKLYSVTVRAAPGDLVNVYGNKLADVNDLDWSVTDGTFTGAPTVEHVDTSARFVTLRLPAGLSATEVYTLTASVGDLTSSVAINDLILWWAKEKVLAGATGYIYGRNLNIRQAPTVTFVDGALAETSATVTALP